jgi:hypothetical protein
MRFVEEDRVTTYLENGTVEVKYRSCGPLSKPFRGIYPKIPIGTKGSCLYVPKHGNIVHDFSFEEAADGLDLLPFLGCISCYMEGCSSCWKTLVDDYWHYNRIFGPKGRKASHSIKFNQDGSYKTHFLEWMYTRHPINWKFVHTCCVEEQAAILYRYLDHISAKSAPHD